MQNMCRAKKSKPRRTKPMPTPVRCSDHLNCSDETDRVCAQDLQVHHLTSTHMRFKPSEEIHPLFTDLHYHSTCGHSQRLSWQLALHVTMYAMHMRADLSITAYHSIPASGEPGTPRLPAAVFPSSAIAALPRASVTVGVEAACIITA